MLWRFVKSEARRLLTRPRLWLAVAAVFGVGAVSLLDGHMVGDEVRSAGALSLGLSPKLAILWPLLSGVGAAGTISEDRQRGYLVAVLSRGLSRSGYLLAKALAMGLTLALASGVCCLGFLMVAAVKLPWGNSVMHSLAPIATGPYPGPVPTLFLTSPLANDLLGLGFLVLGTSALTLIGVIVGAVSKNEYIAMASPMGVFLVGLYLPGKLRFLASNTYLEVWWRYRIVIPPALWPWAGFLYWISFSVICLSVGLLLFARKE